MPEGVTEYVSVFFNSTPDGEAAGGLSNEIDFRNVNLSTTVLVDVNGLLGWSRPTGKDQREYRGDVDNDRRA